MFANHRKYWYFGGLVVTYWEKDFKIPLIFALENKAETGIQVSILEGLEPKQAKRPSKRLQMGSNVMNDKADGNRMVTKSKIR